MMNHLATYPRFTMQADRHDISFMAIMRVIDFSPSNKKALCLRMPHVAMTTLSQCALIASRKLCAT